MFKLQLISKYLRRKLAPMFAALAVTLCTAMVIIVISVMGGFLDMWRDSAKRLTGEITISSGLTGIEHYQEILQAVKQSPDVESATAIIYTFGIVKIDETILKMEIVGIHPDDLDKVVEYKDSIYWNDKRFEKSRENLAVEYETTPDKIRPPSRAVNIIDLADSRDVSFSHPDGTVSVINRETARVLRITGADGLRMHEGLLPDKQMPTRRFTSAGLLFEAVLTDGVVQLKVLNPSGTVIFQGPIDGIDGKSAADKPIEIPDLHRKMRIITRENQRELIVKDKAGKLLMNWVVESELQQASLPLDANRLLTQYRSFNGEDMTNAAITFKAPEQWQTDMPGVVPGVVVYSGPRDEDGEFNAYHNPTLGKKMSITVVQLSDAGGLTDRSSKDFVVVNELKSGFIEFDQNRVYVPFDVLQKMLAMEPALLTDDEGNDLGMSPAKATAVLVKGVPGTPLQQLRDSVHEASRTVAEKHYIGGLRIQTWEEQHATILGAVEKEKFLLVFLFAIISLVAFVMVATTFYNIVLEKTRDIGVLRALGASQGGVASLFLGYGSAIGIVGSIVGFVLAWLIVENINTIQDWLGTNLGQTLFCLAGTAVGILLSAIAYVVLNILDSRALLKWWKRSSLTGIVLITLTCLIIVLNNESLQIWLAQYNVKIWDAKIYYFDKIPAKMNGTEVVIIMIFAVLSSVFGSLIPAIVASQQDPVEALRYE